MLRSAAAFGWVALVVATATAPGSARADERSADAIVKDIDAVVMPVLDASDRGDRDAIQAYLVKRREAVTRKSDLTAELFRVDPANARLVVLLPERWAQLASPGSPGRRTVVTETEKVLARTNDPALKRDASFWRAMAGIQGNASPAEARQLVERFLANAPRKDDRTAQMLMMFGYQLNAPAQAGTHRFVLEKLVEDFPESRPAAMAKGSLRRLNAIGQPFALEFTEAIGGSEISMKSLKGKVVVLDFWATWCGPCVAEMPKMKKLYAEYRDKGVEFIGVSLDQKEGGLEKLKAFVKDKEIPWPQYYQGNGWESEFSSSWGINSIPAVFVIDQDGKVFSVEARGKLETILPQLLARAAAKPAAGGD